jgi:hypothetical protein
MMQFTTTIQSQQTELENIQPTRTAETLSKTVMISGDTIKQCAPLP